VLSSRESEQDLVQNYYESILHRAADPSGLATFTTALAAGIRDEVVLAMLAGSDESSRLDS